MAEPVALRGPAHGPPPIANSPTGSITEDNQHSVAPILKSKFAVPIFFRWCNLKLQYEKRLDYCGVADWRKIAITLIIALRWVLECSGLVSTIEQRTDNTVHDVD